MEAVLNEIKIERYPAYKDSGVEWLGEIPEHWEIVRSKRLFQQRKERARDNDQQLTASQKHGIISQQEFMELEGRRVTQVEFNRDILKHIEANDFVISMRSFQGGIEYSEYSGCVSSAYIPLIPIKHVVPAYFKYLFKSDAYIKALSSTSNLVRDGQALRFENFSDVDLIIVPKEEQIAIAKFLDRKTAQIDKAIAQKEKLIELLKERRQILIHNAVTRGLNPDVPIKDSGVEWIGKIPAHWEMKRMRSIFDYIQTGTTPSTTNTNFFDGAINWFTPKDLNEEILNISERKVSQLAIQKKEIKFFPGNSILIVGIGATAGKTSYMPESSTFNQQITGFHTRGNNNKYYFYLLKDLAKVMLNTADFTTLPILNNEFFKAFILTVPPLEEQVGIVAYIQGLSSKIKRAIEQKVREIEKLKEYKATLINAAVTGKIKVSEEIKHEYSE